MALLIRHTVVWSGSPGLPGYTQFHQEVTGSISVQAQAAQNAIYTFFAGLAGLIPADITIVVDPVYQVADVVTGEVTTEDSVTTPLAGITGGYVSNWSAQVGVMVEWLTAAFIDGRRLRGRTYLVPLGNTSDDDGTLPGGTLSTIRSEAATLLAAGTGLVVWHRPVAGAGGQIAPISSAVVRDHAAILRSRMV